MKNYLIVDTEQTYNVGVIGFNEKGIFLKKQFIIKENFEDRAICGINNYNRKKPLFDKNENTSYTNAGEAMLQISNIIKEHKIKGIFGHNISVDRIALGNLLQQSRPYMKVDNFLETTPLVDTTRLVRLLFPENTKTNLNDTINDIMGYNFRQTHTALDDSYWLYGIIGSLVQYLDIFSVFPYLLENVNDIPLQDSIKRIVLHKGAQFISSAAIFSLISSPDYTIRTLNTRLRKLLELDLLLWRELPKYGKRGDLLKTKDDGYKLSNKGKDYLTRFKDFIEKDFTEEVKIKLTEILVPYVEEAEREALKVFKETLKTKQKTELAKEREALKVFKETLKTKQKTELAKERENLIKEFEKKNEELEEQYKNKSNDLDSYKEKYQEPALLFYINTKDRNLRKEVRHLNKQLKQGHLTVQEYVIKVFEL